MNSPQLRASTATTEKGARLQVSAGAISKTAISCERWPTVSTLAIVGEGQRTQTIGSGSAAIMAKQVICKHPAWLNSSWEKVSTGSGDKRPKLIRSWQHFRVRRLLPSSGPRSAVAG